MKIALIDLVHSTRGVSANTTVPFGIGLLSVYLRNNLFGQLDIKLFRDTEETLKVFKSNSWVPDVVGISQYCWNSQLNLYFARWAKKNNPDCLVVVGGPNLDVSPKKREEYFKKNKFVDLAVAYNGEIPFLDIMRRYRGGESIKDLRKNPPVGTYCLDPDTFFYSVSKVPASRVDSINVFGPVYASGIFDKFLDAGYHPMLETVRGCPFTCAYCYASDSYHSKLLFLAPEIFKQEMEYLGKRLAHRHDIVLYFANSNTGFFDEDMKMAAIVRATQKKYDWPKYINLSTGKDPEKLLKMMSIVDFEPGIALQTLTPRVLKNIGRMNIPLESYVNFQKKILYQRGDTSATELILSLPGETKKTFLKTLSQVINSGVQTIVVYTLMKLAGTPLATEEYAKKFQYIVRHRVVPRQFSEIDGRKILDTEEVIIETKDMSFDDYFYLRGLCFVISVFFSSAELVPLKKLLLELNIDLFKWVLNIFKRLKKFPDINALYDDFMKETREELFESREELLKFYNRGKNFKDLLDGKKGDNLLRKYKYKLLSKFFLPCLVLAMSEAKKLLIVGKNHKEPTEMLKDLEHFLAPRDLRSFFDQSDIKINKVVHLKYNIPEWLHSSTGASRRLNELRGSFKYSLSFTDKQKELFRKLNDSYKSSDLSWQMAYRDNYTKDLWPVWTLENY